MRWGDYPGLSRRAQNVITCIITREAERVYTRTHGEEGDVKTEEIDLKILAVNILVTQSDTKECQQPLEAGRDKEGVSLVPLKGP